MADEPIISAKDAGLPESMTCPFCNGEDTRLHNAFGAHLSVATWWCNRCRSPFEAFKWGLRREDGT
jgi:transcription elongation factor Elf1